MSKNKFFGKEEVQKEEEPSYFKDAPVTEEESVYNLLTSSMLPKRDILDVWIALKANPNHQHEHWLSLATLATEIVRHIDEL